jgi:hypothetical protein
MSAFLAARQGGSGAEDCLAPEALGSYCGPARACTSDDFDRDPGPICLYECKGERFDSVTAIDAGGGVDGRVSVYLQTDFDGGRHQNEALLLGHVPSGAFVIIEATTSA